MDAAPNDDVFAGRMLRRAENILTANNGTLIKELEQQNDHDTGVNNGDDPAVDPGRKIHRTTTFGGSILQKLKGVKSDAVKLLRSRSLSARPNTLGTEEVKARRGHARSLSEFQHLRPAGPKHSDSAPAALDTAGSHKRALSDVAEGSLIMSPAAEGREGNGHPEAKTGADVVVPALLQMGTPMTKVSAKKHKKAVFRLDADLGQIVWESKQHKIIPIESIKEIRTGVDARYHREQFQLSQDYEDRWLTIIYILDGNYKTLHLIVTTKEVFKMWETTLRQLHAIRKELMTGLGNLEVRQALWEKQYWKGADEEQDQKLTFEEVEKLCKRLNINSSQDDLYRLFTQADRQDRGYLEFDDFRQFVKLLKGRPEVHRLYNKLKARNGGVFDFAVFEYFMREKQESSSSREDLEAIFSKYAKSSPPAGKTDSPSMTLEAFNSFLLSPDNAVFSDQHSQVHHDMTLPLSEYYISSSHNTYLVGHQLVGDSTIEGYIRALLHSCRSVEVDIFDGDGEPMIFHGKTFTSKVSLRQVCAAIKKYGFVASPYPIIISAEVHCSVPQQEMIAGIMIEVFGDALVKEPPEGMPAIEMLPSPEELKGRILLKTKNLLLHSPSDSMDSDFSDMSSTSASETELLSDPVGDVPTDKKKKKRNSVVQVGVDVLQRVKSITKPQSPAARAPHLQIRQISSQSVSSNSPRTPNTPITPILAAPRQMSEIGVHVPMSPGPKPLASAKPKMSMALVALLVYTVGVKCRGLNKKEVYAPEHMFSLSENTMAKMVKAGMYDLIKHTRTHLVRVYPRGTRVRSTNYEPHRAWAAGAQLVALNWQTFDMGYMINHAMFQRNGRSGYVMKPLALRAPSKDLLMKRTNHVFQVTVISAQQLPRPKNALGHEIMSGGSVDPFVEVSLYVPDWPYVTSGEGQGKISRSPSVNRKKRESVTVVPLRSGMTTLVAPPLTDRAISSSSTVTNASSIVPPSPSLPVPTQAPSYIPGKTISMKTSSVKNNGFNPVWEEKLRLPFECVGDMMDLVFVKFVVRSREDDKGGDDPLAVYCASLGSLGRGYRHLPLHDSQLSQFLFSTLFVRINILGL